MRFFLIFSFLAVVAFAPLPASAQSISDRLVGTWTCQTKVSTIRFKAIWRYRSNGAFSMDFALGGRLSGIKVTGNGFGTGKWSLNRNRRLTRTFDSFVTTRVRFNNDRLPARDLAELTDIMKQGTILATVRPLRRNSFVEHPIPPDTKTRCRRI
ncbi:MAG: hypothetical protein AAGD34_12995 [Pseudomonadota bacterium]